MSLPRGWIVLSALLLLWALAVLVTGGIFLEWHGWRISSREPLRPFVAGVIVMAIAAWRRGADGFRTDLSAIAFDAERWGLPCAIALSIVTLFVGLFWGTGVAGGADSYGYVSQARLWSEGNLIVQQPIAARVTWPNPNDTLTPLGYKPATSNHAIVPTYAPGLPMLMALFSQVHPAGVFSVVPLAGAGLVALSFLLGRRLAGAAAGLLTAALMATSPAFLFQLVAPMSDVVIAAFWIAALVLALPNQQNRWLAAGLASSFAILVRPNTAPLAAVFVVAALWSDQRNARSYRERVLNAAAYVTGTVPGVLSVAAIHTALYGSPLQSGYGSAADIYALANVLPNLQRYPFWFLRSETSIVLLAAAAPLVMARTPELRWPLMFTTAVAIVTWLCYLAYRPFEEWWYLRFLLTSFPPLLALTAVALVAAGRLLTAAWQPPLAVAVVILLAIWRIDYAKAHGTFDAWRMERRYVETGSYVADRLPKNAVLYSMQQSGSLRYYAGRLTVRWDVLDAGWLDRSIEALKALGYEPYLVLEDPEEGEFRGRFGRQSQLGRLNWAPIATLATQPVVRIYALSHDAVPR